MAIVDYPLGTVRFNDSETVITATVPLDDALFVVGDLPGDLIPTRDATFEGPITGTITGPGRFKVEIWRGTDHADGKNPWRTSESQFPGGITEADSPIVINTGGPVKRMDDVTWEITAAGQ